jgi:hypothetical protein
MVDRIIRKSIVVSDIFIEEYTGGAELSLDAIVSFLPKEDVIFIKSRDLTFSLIEKYKDEIWIFGNYFDVSFRNLTQIMRTVGLYYVLEFDYKYCKYREQDVHEAIEKKPCDCVNSHRGKIISVFLAKASCVFWMSERQRKETFDLFPFLKEERSLVLSSIFKESSLKLLEHHRDLNIKKNGRYFILDSDSHVKGRKAATMFAEANKLPYDLVGNKPYYELLKILSKYKGIIFLPSFRDTCPRLLIEAKILGCEIILNEKVLHRDEEWFQGDSKSILAFLRDRKAIFLERISNA